MRSPRRIVSGSTRSLFAAIWLGASLASCESATRTESPRELAVAESPIIGGMATSGDPAVVLLASYSNDLATLDTCTAALVAPDVVLTAAHCVDPATHAGYTLGVFTGPDASAYSTPSTLAPQLVAITEVHLAPGYDTQAPFHGDLAVAKLAKPLSVTPLPMRRTAPTAADVGLAARIVGYGQIQYNTLNLTKQTADTVIAAVDADDTITVGDTKHRSCVGDSGGPALMTIDGVETIVGVDSYTDLQGCLEPAHYRRTDFYTSFLDTFVPPPPPPTTATTTSSAGSGGASGGAGGALGEDTGGCSVALDDRSSPPWRMGLLACLSLIASSALARRKRRSLT